MTTVDLRRPRPPAWVPGLAAAGGTGLILAALLVVGFVLVGVHAGPVSWGRLLSSRTWDPSRDTYGAAAMIYGTVAVSALAEPSVRAAASPAAIVWPASQSVAVL